jgi:hypothetical protein
LFSSNLRLTIDQLLPGYLYVGKGIPCIQLWIPVTKISWRRWWLSVSSVNLISVSLSWAFHPTWLGWLHWKRWSYVSWCSRQVGQSIV